MERTRATSKKRDGHTKVYYQGFSYVRANITSVKISYRCSSYRQKCKARFVYVAATISFDFSELVPHTCRSGSALQSRTAQADGSPCEDVSEAVLEEVDQLAVETNMTQRGIWLYVMDKFYMQSGPPVRGVSKNAVENRVKYARGKKTGGNRNRAVELPPMSKVRGSMQGFFQFQYSWHDDIKAQKDSVSVDRVLAWAHPELRNLLRFENLSWFLDGTFRCAPAGYKQCVTIMVHESSTDLYIPAIFTVATSMQKEHYVKLLRCIEDCVGRKLTPKEVVCDFEAALIGAIRACFPDVRIIGCLFHFKQACRRKLKEYQIPREEAKLAMAPNVFDILTVIDPSKIEVQGIAWVKAKIKKVCEAKQVTYSRRKWRKFWDYFRRTWLEMFPPTYWNVFGMRRDIVSRTNNPLERFHRHLNGKIKAPHPAISSFVDMLEGISREYVAQRLAIQFGLARPPRRKRFQLPRAPQLPEVADIVDSEESEDEGEQPTVATDDPASCSSAPGSEDDAAEMDHETADYSPDNSFGYDGDASAIV